MIQVLRIKIYIYSASEEYFNYFDKYTSKIGVKAIESFDINKISDTTVITTILSYNTNPPTYDGQITVFLYLDMKTEKFMKEYSSQSVDKEIFPVMILDFSTRLYLNAEDISIFYGIHFFGSYSPLSKSILNTALVQTVDTFKGDALELLDDVVMALYNIYISSYNSYLLIDAAINDGIDPQDSTGLRTFFYGNKIESPSGYVIVDKSNYISTYSFILQFLEGEQPIESELAQPIAPIPYYSEVY